MNMNNLIRRTAPQKVAIDAQLSVADTYAALEWYYHNNGLYALLQQDLMTNGLWTEGMVGLRNPAHRVVEFYAAKLWGGPIDKALPIVTENDRIVDPIKQVWKWSNWGAEKQVTARWFAMFGDYFIKIASKTDETGKPIQVYLQSIKPAHVTDMETDNRGYITRIRIDVPQMQAQNQKTVTYYHTEIWDKTTQTYRRWETEGGPSLNENRLGNPQETQPLSYFGINFVPVVHAKFQDIGEERGTGAFTHVLDKLDEANRMATRLHQLLYRFNDVTWAVRANMQDPSGRPLPAPALALDGRLMDDSTMTIGTGTKVARLPGYSELQSLVPDLHYADALAILQDHIRELERDLPEMTYARLREQSGAELSGRAIRYLLSDAIDKVLEARGNAEDGLARADAMALTIGQGLGIFTGLGDFEAGDFEHTFAERDVIPLSQAEKREIAVIDLSLGVSKDTILRSLGFDPEVEKAKRAEEDQNLGDNLLAAFDQGNQVK